MCYDRLANLVNSSCTVYLMVTQGMLGTHLTMKNNILGCRENVNSLLPVLFHRELRIRHRDGSMAKVHKDGRNSDIAPLFLALGPQSSSTTACNMVQCAGKWFFQIANVLELDLG